MNGKASNPEPSRLRDQIFGSPGYSTDLALSLEELEVFRDAIFKQWLSVIAMVYPEHVETFDRHGLAQYHRFSHLVEHNKLWLKERRLLPREDVDLISALPFVTTLQRAFGDFVVSDALLGNTVVPGRKEIYWRIVRPGHPSDVGPLHADKWFHNSIGSGQAMFPPSVSTAKVWIPIYCEPGKSGLIVVPESHKRDWLHKYVDKDGCLKPELCETIDSTAFLIETDPGTLVIFNENLLHGGAVNRGTMTRVSAEITMVFNSNRM